MSENKCMWCDKDSSLTITTGYQNTVRAGLSLGAKDRYEDYLSTRYLYACEDHRNQHEKISLEEIRKLEIKDPKAMSLEDWIKAEKWFNGDDEEE